MLPITANNLNFVLLTNDVFTLAFLQIVEDDTALFGSADNVLAVGWDTEFVLSWPNFESGVLESMEVFSHSDVPNFQCVIFWRWDDIVLIWCKSHTAHRICMSIIELEKVVPRLCIPNSDRPVIMAWHQISLRSGNVHVENFWIRIDHMLDVTSAHVPKLDSAIIRCSNGLSHWKAELGWSDQIWVSHKVVHWSNLILQSVNSGLVVDVCAAYQVFIVQREGEARDWVLFRSQHGCFIHLFGAPKFDAFVCTTCG